jgi:hypothetical protein
VGLTGRTPWRPDADNAEFDRAGRLAQRFLERRQGRPLGLAAVPDEDLDTGIRLER